jgi:CDP-glycerol glycerophosphotransferase (TagB/SpsB family)
MLREPGVRHVFVGHGDSDKTASFNPFSKVYSEIWVAGEGGRDRYRRAAVGIRDEDIVEVGRPQLDGIRVVTEPIGDRVVTVLYAPTWEGWTGDPAHTSLMRTGPALVERLVGFPNVRVIYKPHPFTGTVSGRAGAADAEIRAIVARAGGGNRTVVGPSPTLYDCFNDADLMIADISSVLTDFIYSEKPYVVPNLSGLSEDRFRERYPSVGMAYLLDPKAERIGAILDLVRDGDPLASDRRALKHYLLGPDKPDAMTRFAAAVDAAYDRAVSDLPVRIVAGLD